MRSCPRTPSPHTESELLKQPDGPVRDHPSTGRGRRFQRRHPEGLNDIRKYEVSCSVDTSWQGSVLLRDIADVWRLRHADGPNLLTERSTELVHAPLASDLVNAMTVLAFPVVLGGNKTLFADGSAPRAYQAHKVAPVEHAHRAQFARSSGEERKSARAKGSPTPSIRWARASNPLMARTRRTASDSWCLRRVCRRLEWRVSVAVCGDCVVRQEDHRHCQELRRGWPRGRVPAGVSCVAGSLRAGGVARISRNATSPWLIDKPLPRRSRAGTS
jgi:hypothetical protein